MPRRSYRWRRDEDRAALEPLGITCVHAGLTEALFRRRPANLSRSRLTHVYPFYLAHVTSGRIVAADAGMLREVREIIHRVAGSGPTWCWRRWAWMVTWTAILVRTAAQSSGGPVAYYRDFPGSRRDPAAEAFIYRHDLVETRWPEPAEAKATLIRTYGSQTGQRLPWRGPRARARGLLFGRQTHRDGLLGLVALIRLPLLLAEFVRGLWPMAYAAAGPGGCRGRRCCRSARRIRRGLRAGVW